jgi:ATP-dependent DNA ligase
MAARIDNGRVQLLTRTRLDWTSKYPGAAAAPGNLNVETAYLDGELCGVHPLESATFSRRTQKAFNPDDMANGPIDLNHVPRRLTSAEAQALGAIESRPA